MIHPTAIIDPKAEIDENVRIGPYTIIGDNVSIGAGSVIAPHVTIDPYVKIGPGCHIFQYASIGAVPQALKFEGEVTWLTIGANTVIREFATLNRGTGFGGGITEIGEENFLMAYTHVAHDCKTGKGVVMANNATLAGHIIIGDYVIIGGLTAIHQFVRIGDHAYVGGKSAIVKDIPPYVIAAGDRAVLHGLNKVGLRRYDFSEETLGELKKTYRIIFREGIPMKESVDRVLEEVENIPEVVKFVEFIRTTERGITR
ncbi:MAG: acyl-ACP--UDP-N-acetylglucosamine O-acyltransferase [Deltaproteobacteria bacterium]|nr:acyl-ACP--UDP-N-acetylglucosamine O-acyltransferase [Deltaproteobacteria bacterium]